MKRAIKGMGLLVLASWIGLAQPAKQPAFEVAAVRAAPPEPEDPYQAGFRMGRASRGLVIEGKRASITANGLKDLVRIAYEVKDYQVTAPPGLSAQLFDITATLPGGADPGRAPEMLRALLEERFHLKAHWEPKERPVYALVSGKGGIKAPKAEEAPGSKAATEFSAMGVARSVGGGGVGGPGVRHIRLKATTMAKLADLLTRSMDRPVIDMTELDGKYDVDLTFAPPDSPSADSAPSLATALQESLGLKLEARKTIVKTVVIDSVDKMPTEN